MKDDGGGGLCLDDGTIHEYMLGIDVNGRWVESDHQWR